MILKPLKSFGLLQTMMVLMVFFSPCWYHERKKGYICEVNEGKKNRNYDNTNNTNT